MKSNTIEIEGKEYPCYMTMGAMLEFKDRTGKEISEVRENEISLIVVLMFCCILSACRKEKKEFPYLTEMDMADQLGPDAFIQFQVNNFPTNITGDPDMSTEKKKE